MTTLQRSHTTTLNRNFSSSSVSSDTFSVQKKKSGSLKYAKSLRNLFQKASPPPPLPQVSLVTSHAPQLPKLTITNPTPTTPTFPSFDDVFDSPLFSEDANTMNASIGSMSPLSHKSVGQQPLPLQESMLQPVIHKPSSDGTQQDDKQNICKHASSPSRTLSQANTEAADGGCPIFEEILNLHQLQEMNDHTSLAVPFLDFVQDEMKKLDEQTLLCFLEREDEIDELLHHIDKTCSTLDIMESEIRRYRLMLLAVSEETDMLNTQSKNLARLRKETRSSRKTKSGDRKSEKVCHDRYS
ncbi:uncharacterized protein L203_102479 [Cryptococcus depauperatus CBS 7841]|uniref:Uncharacterized protein n=1 Tax=Cryptococcus depauperatus CBS 7841 TaxID=1295531 RepID=A0AAJ8M156_9TREE